MRVLCACMPVSVCGVLLAPTYLDAGSLAGLGLFLSLAAGHARRLASQRLVKVNGALDGIGGATGAVPARVAGHLPRVCVIRAADAVEPRGDADTARAARAVGRPVASTEQAGGLAGQVLVEARGARLGRRSPVTGVAHGAGRATGGPVARTFFRQEKTDSAGGGTTPTCPCGTDAKRAG